MPPFNQSSHIAIEESQNQSSDMTTIYIRITHNHHFMIAEFFKIQCFTIFFGSYSYPQCSKDIPNFFIIKNSMRHGFFDVQYFSSKRKDSLELSISSLFGGSSCGVSLH